MTAMLAAATSAGKQARWKMPVVLIGLLAFIAIFAPFLAPYSDSMMDNYDAMINRAPSLAHPFGTDPLGRDVLSRVIYGSRVSLSLAVAAALLAVGLATCYGSLAGLIGGTIDRVLMRALDVALSIPRLLLLLAVTALWQGLPLWGLILCSVAPAGSMWPGWCAAKCRRCAAGTTLPQRWPQGSPAFACSPGMCSRISSRS
jgi:ABC-type dipeptide/oligopeptide/nickel transport system permease subunit